MFGVIFNFRPKMLKVNKVNLEAFNFSKVWTHLRPWVIYITQLQRKRTKQKNPPFYGSSFTNITKKRLNYVPLPLLHLELFPPNLHLRFLLSLPFRPHSPTTMASRGTTIIGIIERSSLSLPLYLYNYMSVRKCNSCIYTQICVYIHELMCIYRNWYGDKHALGIFCCLKS